MQEPSASQSRPRFGCFAGITWPVAYGGHGLTLREHLIANQEIGRLGLPESVNSLGKELAGPINAARSDRLDDPMLDSTAQLARHLEPQFRAAQSAGRIMLAQAVGQMFARLGVKAEVRTMPTSMLFSRGSKLEFSVMLSGWVGNGEASSPLVALMATYNPKTGMSPSNRGRWSNPAFDLALGHALSTLDDTRRNAFYAQAAEIAVGEMGVIPVYFTVNSWATRKGITYEARGDEQTWAMGMRPAR